MPHFVRPVAFAAMVSLATPVWAAGPQGDWFASLYTGEGIELRNDERVFTLFSVLNATGFDQGPVTRREPVPKIIYHPVRQAVRARVLGGDPEVRKAAEAFFDAHPVSLQRYLAYAVGSGQPPFKEGAKGLAEVKGLEAVLAKAWAGWRLDELMGQVQQEYRKALKSYLTVVDQPLLKARATLKLPETSQTLLVVNLLDAQDTVRGALGDGGDVYLVVGPSDKPNVEGVLREFARMSVEPVVAKKVSAASWPGGATVLREAQLAGANEQTVQEYATSVFTTAVALKAIDASDAAYDAAAARGYFGIKEVAKLFDEGKPFESWVFDGLQRVETRRPAKK